MLKVDNTTLFSGKESCYSASRPTYPAEALEWLFRQCTSAKRVVDIGAGTGIFTELLQKYFPDITAVEPNMDMRREFITCHPDIPVIAATGEATTLPAGSIDLITVAQAFHWLDEDLFKFEAQRILAAGGKTAIIWNNRISGGIGQAQNEVSRKYCPRFSCGYAGKRSPAEGDDFLQHKYFRSVQLFRCRNFHTMTEETFIKNALSRSYSLTAEDENYTAYIAELQAAFRRFAVGNKVCEEYETVIYLGTF